MPQVAANGIQIAYDTIGDRTLPAMLLIAGNGAQLLFWDTPFCELLAKAGFFVIRFDNRDVGLSTKFEAAGIPDMHTCGGAMVLAPLRRVREGMIPSRPPEALPPFSHTAPMVNTLLASGISPGCGWCQNGLAKPKVLASHCMYFWAVGLASAPRNASRARASASESMPARHRM